MFDIKIGNETLHGSSGTMKAKTLGKKMVQIEEVDGTKKCHPLKS